MYGMVTKQTPPTGEKPLRADARRNRARVLDAARAAFASEGISVSLDEIARRAGVGPGTVYRHFPTKEALFEAAVVGNIRQLVEDAHALAAEADSRAALFDFVMRLVEHGSVNRALADGLARGGIEVGSVAGQAGGELMAAMAVLLARAQQDGVVRTDVTAKHVKALVAGILTAADWLGGDADARRHLTRVMCDGLRVPAP